jgi:hypothetical protein
MKIRGVTTFLLLCFLGAASIAFLQEKASPPPETAPSDVPAATDARVEINAQLEALAKGLARAMASNASRKLLRESVAASRNHEQILVARDFLALASQKDASWKELRDKADTTATLIASSGI